MRLADFFREHPRQNVRGAAGRKRHHELDRAAGLRLCSQAQQHAERDRPRQSVQHSNLNLTFDIFLFNVISDRL